MAPPAEIRRRRLRALAAVAGVAAVLGAVAGGGGDSEEPAPGASTLPPECAQEGPDGLRRAAGQMVMAKVEASASRDLQRAAETGAIGGVIVFPPPDAGTGAVSDAIERLQDAAAQGSQPPLLVATDQEGGEVKRFLEGPPTLAPAEIAAAGGEAEAERQGAETGRYLAGLGINVDLAPVLDVPGSPVSFLGSRTFGADPQTVAKLGVAFARGLESAGVAATAKHFPGLGSADVNTDFSESTVAAPRSALRAGLEPFEAAIAAGVPLVMVGHAAYPAFGAQGPASLDRGIVEGRLRDRLGFEGVTITDDLGAGAIAAAASPKDAVLEAVDAGEDILLFAQESDPNAVEPIAKAAEAGGVDPALVRGACERIVGLKNSLGA
jgi:beta-N-acetylhexosaminidase